MRNAIPWAGDRLCLYFGHCEPFALIDIDQSAQQRLQTRFLTPPPHEPGVLPRWLHEQGADVIVAGGVGQRAQQLFAANGIKVVVGTASDTPQKTVRAYLDGSLVSGYNPCDH